MKRVVITGVSAVSPVGIGRGEVWDNIKNGVCGIDRVSRFDPEPFITKIAAEVKDFDPLKYIDKREAKRMDLYVQYAVASAGMALSDACIDMEKEDKTRIGVMIGTGIGGMKTHEDQHSVFLNKGAGRVSPFYIPMMIANMAVGQVAITTGAKGVNLTTVSACASGTDAVGCAFHAVKRGDADIIISGGTEAALTPMAFAGFCSMKAMSIRNDDPKGASSPFDLNRDGFVLGEGAAILIIEEYEHAIQRNAHIIAEIVGYGSTNDAYHITAPAPSGEGGARCMQMALQSAGIKAEDISYINAHGTSTPYNDKFETEAIKKIFGEHAYKLKVSSTKSMTGHMLGAAGAIEAMITALALHDGFIPPTINYKTPDPECDLDYTVNKGISANINYALSNSLGFGGHNAALVLERI